MMYFVSVKRDFNIPQTVSLLPRKAILYGFWRQYIFVESLDKKNQLLPYNTFLKYI